MNGVVRRRHGGRDESQARILKERTSAESEGDIRRFLITNHTFSQSLAMARHAVMLPVCDVSCQFDNFNFAAMSG